MQYNVEALKLLCKTYKWSIQICTSTNSPLQNGVLYKTFSYNVWLATTIIHRIYKWSLVEEGIDYEIRKPKTLLVHFAIVNQRRFTSSCPNQISIPCTQCAYKNQHISYKSTLKSTCAPNLLFWEIWILEWFRQLAPRWIVLRNNTRIVDQHSTYRSYHHICQILQGVNDIIIKWITKEYLFDHRRSISIGWNVLHLRPQHPMTWVQCGYVDIILLKHRTEDFWLIGALSMKLHPKWIDDVEPFGDLLGSRVFHPHVE